jgi:hypothetical protein
LAVIGLSLLPAYSAVRLFKAWNRETSRFGPFEYSREHDPFIFWIMVGFDVAALIFFTWLWILIIRHQFF